MKGREKGPDSVLALNRTVNRRVYTGRDLERLLERHQSMYMKASSLLDSFGSRTEPTEWRTTPTPYIDRDGFEAGLTLVQTRADHFPYEGQGPIALEVIVHTADGHDDPIALFILGQSMHDIHGNLCDGAQINEVQWLLGGMETDLKALQQVTNRPQP